MSGKLVSGALVLLLSSYALSQSEEQNAYCEYVIEQAMAQRDAFRTPSAVGGVAQPSTGTPPQMYWGLSNSLANYSKAKLSMEVARRNCESYRATTGASLQIQYALRRLEKDALRHRADLLQQAIEQLDGIVKRNLKLVEVRNITRPMLYSLHSTRAKLIADKMNTELKMASLYVSDAPNNVPLKELVYEKQNREAEAQKSIATFSRQSNWDVRLEAGGRQRLTPFFRNPVEPYGEVTFTYNLGSRRNDNHLDKATVAYMNWKKVQDGDVVHSAQVLEQQIRQSIEVEQAQLKELRETEKEIDANLLRLVGVDTTAALDFSNQLNADKLALHVELGDTSFRLQQLQGYLKENFELNQARSTQALSTLLSPQ